MVSLTEDLGDVDGAADRGQQAVVAHPLVVVELAEVVAAAVGQDDDDDLVDAIRLPDQVAHQGTGCDESRAARFAREDPFLARDPACHREGVAVRHPHPAVDRRRVVRAGEEVLADAFGQVGPRRVAAQDGSFGVGPDDDQVGLLPAKVVNRSADGAAGPDAGHEVRDPAFGLLPDLGPGGRLVSLRVLLVPVLVGLERARDVPRKSGGDGVVGIG